MVRSEVMEVGRVDQEVSEKEKERSKRSERDKERTREKEKEKHREKDRDREKEKDRDREKEKDRDREKEKDRDREKEKDRDREKEKDRDREKEKERAKEKEKEKERERAKEKEKDRSRDRGRDREKEKEKEKEKEREKDRHRHGHDKEHEAAKEKERHHEKSGHKEHDGAREKHREKSPHEADVKKEKSEKSKTKEEKHGAREKTRDKDEKAKEKHSERDKSKDDEKHKARDKDEKKHNSKDEDREKHKAREKEEKKHSSKDEEKEEKREREKEKAKDREREKEKEREERDRDRDNEKDRRSRHREHEHNEHEHDHHRSTRDMDIDDNPGAERAHDQQHVSSSELADRLARMREERRKANFDRRPGRRGIRASEKPEDVDDIASWVNKSRHLDEKKKAEEREKAARMAKALEEQENEEEDSDEEFQPESKYSAKDLAGLKVRHGLDKVMEGGAVVLTLRDTSILADGDINDETDELENFELAQQTAREEAYKAAKKVAGKYEDKFNNDLTGNKTILSKYDDAVKEEGVTLDETGGIDEEAQKKLEEVRRRLQHGMGDRLAESLLTTTSTRPSEYFTQDEMTTFKKPKKKKKLRKKDKLDLDALEAEAVAEGLGTTDLGSRDPVSRRVAMQDEMKAAADARRERYDNAVAKAADASRLLKEGSEAKAMDVDESEAVIVGAEEEEILQKSLDRARLAALKKLAENASGPQAIAARLAAEKQESPQAQGDGDADEGKLIFSDTGEFCRSLQLDEALTRRSAPKDVFHEEEEKEEGELDPLDEDAPAMAPVRGGWTEVGDVDMTDKFKEIPEMEEDSLDEVKEMAVGKGLAGVLQLLKERGSLKETVDWGGRNMDKKKSKLIGIVDESNNVVGQRDILLDRVDEFGRTMTPKEAFRKLSHKFHGKGPGKMKQEKRQKQFQEELKLKQMNAGDTPLMAMEKIREAQAKLHAPYLVISGHIKPGQTSDPRSGFATVEKEPVGSLTPMLGDNKNIGSLTPMLGDKKVAHFLGIKRKPESGSMGPPQTRSQRITEKRPIVYHYKLLM